MVALEVEQDIAIVVHVLHPLSYSASRRLDRPVLLASGPEMVSRRGYLEKT